jgi:hypothetical protein
VSALVTSTSRARRGALWDTFADGVRLVRVDDLARRRKRGLVVGPDDADAVIRFLGGDPALLPLPGEADDYLTVPVPDRD